MPNLNKIISTQIAILIIVFVSVGVAAAFYIYQNDIPSGSSQSQEEKESYIKILSPNGGEVFEQGQNITITWTSEGIDKVYIYAYYYDENDNIGDPGSSEEFIFNSGECRLTYESISADIGSYTYKGDGRCGGMPPGERIKIEIVSQGTNIKDASDNYFAIEENVDVKACINEWKEIFPDNKNDVNYTSGEVIVTFVSNISLDNAIALINGYGLTPRPSETYFNQNKSMQVDVPVGIEIESMCKLKQDTQIENARLNLPVPSI